MNNCPFCNSPLKDLSYITEAEFIRLFDTTFQIPQMKYYYCEKCERLWVDEKDVLYETSKKDVMEKEASYQALLKTSIVREPSPKLAEREFGEEERKKYLKKLKDQKDRLGLMLEQKEREAARERADEIRERGGIVVSETCLKCKKPLYYVIEFERGVCQKCYDEL